MRIYLDSNVFRDLKKTENQSLYNMILSDKERNYYCFSEAHLQDLSQDKTDKKFSDMEFMETIVGSNCWHYGKNLELSFRTPKDYYADYEWDTGKGFMQSDDEFIVLIKELFRNIPLSFKELINPGQLPLDFPEELKSVLIEPSTMLDFMDALLDMSDSLTEEQPKFKRLLQYLHKTAGMHGIYEQMGIRGYDGMEITNWDSFGESFKELVYQRSTQKDLYNLFGEMHVALDLYGIVKGKPKKQKLTSLLNDSKHTYYAGHAHILVTSDIDMIAKSKLVYKIWQISTIVFNPNEFHDFLLRSNSMDLGVSGLFAQFENTASLPIVYEEYSLDQIFIQKELPGFYLGEFNMLSCVSAKGSTYYYFDQFIPIISLPVLTLELERVVNILVDYFGNDELGRGKLDRTELNENNWKGREWRNGEMGILLHLNGGIKLSFFKAAPIPVGTDTQGS